MPSSIGLTTLSRMVVVGGRTLRRDEAARVVAGVAALMIDAGNSDEVLRKLSHGQLGDDDLVVSKEERYDNVVARSAEFVDLLHASMHGAFTLPAESWLDLRFELQFFDDPEAAEGDWTYVLLGTENKSLEAAWAGIDTVERYDIPEPDALQRSDVEEGLAQRERLWSRVTAPYVRSSPVSWKAPDPQLLFDIVDSLGHLDGDAARAEAGEITVTLVAEALAPLIGVSSGEAIEVLQRPPQGA
jgi:hypothetical protein